MEQKHENTTAPQHSPLSWYATGAHVQSAAINEDNYICEAEGDSNQQAETNARLIVASVNAIGELAQHLDCNPVELAERLQGGGLVELVNCLTRVERGLTDLGASGEPLKSIRKSLARLTGKNNI